MCTSFKVRLGKDNVSSLLGLKQKQHLYQKTVVDFSFYKKHSSNQILSLFVMLRFPPGSTCPARGRAPLRGLGAGGPGTQVTPLSVSYRKLGIQGRPLVSHTFRPQ